MLTVRTLFLVLLSLVLTQKTNEHPLLQNTFETSTPSGILKKHGTDQIVYVGMPKSELAAMFDKPIDNNWRTPCDDFSLNILCYEDRLHSVTLTNNTWSLDGSFVIDKSVDDIKKIYGDKYHKDSYMNILDCLVYTVAADGSIVSSSSSTASYEIIFMYKAEADASDVPTIINVVISLLIQDYSNEPARILYMDEYNSGNVSIRAIDVPGDGMSVASISHSGDGDFIIGQNNVVIFRRRGVYQGQVALPTIENENGEISISADGTWMVKIWPISTSAISKTISGRGDYISPGFFTCNVWYFTHEGEGAFSVNQFTWSTNGEMKKESVLSSIGPFSGEISRLVSGSLDNITFFEIITDGTWILEPLP